MQHLDCSLCLLCFTSLQFKWYVVLFQSSCKWFLEISYKELQKTCVFKHIQIIVQKYVRWRNESREEINYVKWGYSAYSIWGEKKKTLYYLINTWWVFYLLQISMNARKIPLSAVHLPLVSTPLDGMSVLAKLVLFIQTTRRIPAEIVSVSMGDDTFGRQLWVSFDTRGINFWQRWDPIKYHTFCWNLP